MDPTHYRTLPVSRGFQYNVYYTSAAPEKPTLLFVHGFPSTSYDWRRQVPYFEARGFGIVAPDLLGAGLTSKPLDPTAFRHSALAQDIVEILDALGLDKVVGVGHDWGCVFLSRLSMHHQSRFYGIAWLGVGFREPSTRAFDLERAIAESKAQFGYEWYAYWEFFARSDAAEVIVQHIDSFMQLAYLKDADAWLTWLMQRGKAAECIETDVLLGRPDWLPENEYDKVRKDLLTNGVASQVLWYKNEMEGNDLEENLNMSKDLYTINVPSLFVGAKKDVLCVEVATLPTMQKRAKALKIVSLDAGHYLQLECADEVNKTLAEWLATVPL
ncbi:alpha/beta hydrolase [Phanerochaete sordida]|uniref:Alpha/beta hydrolase n=1 Tax=Phanerochaete sordida TaxID=48140 RepID=A0A9P3GGW0_9APHY|nr:alpha/beta hydrolase [Phanerochaete sordida]